MSVDAFAAAFPVLTATVGGAGFLADLAKMQPHFAGDRAELKVPRKGRPRGFWNTCGVWCFDDHPGAKASAAFRLAVIEAGLVQARRASKEQKFRKEFLNNEEGFEDAIAELRLLGALGPLAPTVDVERPAEETAPTGKKTPPNYDVHLEWADGTELHIDSKRRDPDNEIGSLNYDRQLDVEELLGRGFSAFAWLSLSKNFHAPGDALEAAVVVDEARRIAYDAPEEMSPVQRDPLPDWLTASSVVGVASMALLQGREVLGTRVNGRPAVFVVDEQTFYIDHDLVFSVRLLPGGNEKGYCFIIPAAETQPSLSVEARHAWMDEGDYDRRNPESLAIQGLIAKVLRQLPSRPLNVIAVAMGTAFDFDDLELAVLGEPIPGDGPEGFQRDHGTFQDAAYDGISGVLAFTVTPPDGTTGVASPQSARYWANPRCGHQIDPGLVDAICNALTASPTK